MSGDTVVSARDLRVRGKVVVRQAPARRRLEKIRNGKDGIVCLLRFGGGFKYLSYFYYTGEMMQFEKHIFFKWVGNTN